MTKKKTIRSDAALSILQEQKQNVPEGDTFRYSKQVFAPHHLFLFILLIIMTAGTGEAWGVDNPPIKNGLYMIASKGGPENGSSIYSYSTSNKDNNFYLCPANGCFFNPNANNSFLTENNGMPHLTTYKSFAHNTTSDAIWLVTSVTVSGTLYYRFYHIASEKYLTYNTGRNISNNNTRLIVHLQSFDVPDEDNTLFIITSPSDGQFCIRPKNVTNTSNALNVSSDNYDYLTPGSNKGGIQGTIGHYANTAAASIWYFERQKCDAPNVTFDVENERIVITSSQEGANVYYTVNDEFDFSNSTAYTGPIEKGETVKTIKAVCAKYTDGIDQSDVVTILFNPNVTLSTGASAPYNSTAYQPAISTVKLGETTIDDSEYTVSEYRNEDGETVTGCKAVGTYTVVVSDATGGDYVVYGTTTFTITPATLTVTPAEGQSKGFGDDDPELTYTQTGLAGDDDVADVLTGELSREEGENVGTYAINQGSLAIASGNHNYTMVFNSDTPVNFTITRKSIGNGDAPADGITISIVRNADDSFTTSVMNNGQPMAVGTEGSDYDFSLSSTGNASTKYYEVIITGANNYGGSCKAKYANITLTKRDDDTTPGGACTFVTDSNGDTDFATPEGMTAYIVTAVNSSTVTIQAIDYIPENVPVLLLSTEDTNGFQVQPREGGVDVDSDDNMLLKADQEEAFSTGNIYLLYKGEFVLNMPGTLPAGKVYLPKPGGTPAPSRLSIKWDEATDIDNTLYYPITSLPSAWYTLDGRRLSGQPTKKGLYLRDGQKAVMK